MKSKKVIFPESHNIEVREDEIDLEDVSPEEIVIKKHYSLISPGTELACLADKENWFELPGTPGYAAVGEVVEVGDHVSDVETGQIAYFFGSHSEYEKISTDRFFLATPDSLDEKLIPFVKMTTIAMTSLRVSDIELGDYVMVTGQGLVGNLAAQLAKLQGAFVITTDLSDRRVELSRNCGADLALNPNKTDLKDEIRKFTELGGVSTLIEATGIPKVAVESLELIANEGELILLGTPRGEYRDDITELLNYCHLEQKGNITFKGAHEWRLPPFHNEYVKHSMERGSKIVFKLMEQGKLNIKDLLTHVIEPEEAEEAYDGLKEKKDEYLGVLMDWT
ncbi:alcohol dehydrogenase [candidate division MSBL1 archaeon SCGC-AAA259O05]|uniref:Alcohol dehydrogenase n=1 Tax=candidate division MSBL1 archaeon SCGC-AAA259O05 TaxID=1698271 RepID=A0A133V5A1_9EURY|nr:alcohol dehydrogenase [candidate division MSBL1 archaeon SCGC-AAA259O05]